MISLRTFATLTIPLSLAVSGLFALGPALADGTNFPNDVPSSETSLSELMPPIKPLDRLVHAFGDGQGTVLVAAIQGEQLRSMRSTDGGASYGAETVVAGDITPPVLDIAMGAVDDGAGARVYGALLVADPDGDVGLQVVRTDDLGQSWTAPTNVVRRGDATHGVYVANVAAGPGDRVAVVYLNRWDGHIYAQVSVDAGTTWTSPVRVDGQLSGLPVSTEPNMVAAIDDNGVIHVAYEQNRGALTRIYYTRSTNDGISFETERVLTACSGGAQSMSVPRLEITDGGDLLLGFFETLPSDAQQLSVLRSTDQGLTFSCSLAEGIDPSRTGTSHYLKAASDSSTVISARIECDNEPLLFCAGNVYAQRSDDSGASFGPSEAIGSGAAPFLQNGAVWLNDSGSGGFATAVASRGLDVLGTDAGTWVVAWLDEPARGSDAAVTGRSDGVIVVSSSDDGLSWGTPTRASSVATNETVSISPFPGSDPALGFFGLAPGGADDIAVAWPDGREDGRTRDIYGNRAPAGSLSFGTDVRVDQSASEADQPPGCAGFAMAKTGTDQLHVAFGCFVDSSPGASSQLFVTRSTDRGSTFEAPQRVSLPPASEGERSTLPASTIVATEDGHVYVVYVSIRGSTQHQQVRFNRSTDGGNTWLTEDVLLGELEIWGDFPEIAANEGGQVYVTWRSDEDGDGSADLLLSRSQDSGSTFTTEDVDQGTSDPIFPALCAQDGDNGQRVMLAFQSFDGTWATVSEDGGETWSPKTLLSDGTPTIGPVFACDDVDRAHLSWWRLKGEVDPVTFEYREFNSLRGSLFDGSTWSDSVILKEGRVTPDDAEFAGSDHVAVLAREDNGVANRFGSRLFSIVSEDGGQTFGPPQRLDRGSPQEGRVLSAGGNLSTDGAGNVWALWNDQSAGASSVAVRYSQDHGESFGAVHRMNRETPQGSQDNYLSELNVVSSMAASVVLPESGGSPATAWATWGGDREGNLGEALVNSFEVDADAAAPGSLPGESADLMVRKTAGDELELEWSADCGSGTLYGIYRGDLDSGYESIAIDQCSVSGTTATVAEGASSGEFFLVVPEASEFEGSYGRDSAGEQRSPASDACRPLDQLDACAR